MFRRNVEKCAEIARKTRCRYVAVSRDFEENTSEKCHFLPVF